MSTIPTTPPLPVTRQAPAPAHGVHAAIASVIPGWQGDLEDLLTVLGVIVAALSVKGIVPGGDALTIASGVIAALSQAIQHLPFPVRR
jgi:hypothetical protein